MTIATSATLQREAEEKQIEAVKAECNKLVASMRAAQPAEAARLKTRLDETIKHYPKLPFAFRRNVLAEARAGECQANTRAADAALNAALAKAREDDTIERNRLVGQARGFASKAMMLGADATFRTILNRKIEIIMLSGGVEQKGPTLAKPLYATPRMPYRVRS